MKLALSISGMYATRQKFCYCKNAGIEAVEVSCGSIENADATDFQKTREYADEYGIKLWSHHLPFCPFEKIDISMPALADYTVEYFCSLIDKASAVGIKTFVLHQGFLLLQIYLNYLKCLFEHHINNLLSLDILYIYP